MLPRVSALGGRQRPQKLPWKPPRSSEFRESRLLQHHSSGASLRDDWLPLDAPRNCAATPLIAAPPRGAAGRRGTSPSSRWRSSRRRSRRCSTSRWRRRARRRTSCARRNARCARGWASRRGEPSAPRAASARSPSRRRRRRAAAAARRAGNHHRRRRDVRHGDALAQTPVEWRNKHGRFMHRGLLLRPGGLSLCKRGRAEVEGALINVAASVTELAGLGLRVRLDGGGEVELKLASDADRRRVADAIRASAAAPPTAAGVPAALPAAPRRRRRRRRSPTDAEAAEAMRASTARCHAAALRSGASALTHRAAPMSAAARSEFRAVRRRLRPPRRRGRRAPARWPPAGGGGAARADSRAVARLPARRARLLPRLGPRGARVQFGRAAGATPRVGARAHAAAVAEGARRPRRARRREIVGGARPRAKLGRRSRGAVGGAE